MCESPGLTDSLSIDSDKSWANFYSCRIFELRSVYIINMADILWRRRITSISLIINNVFFIFDILYFTIVYFQFGPAIYSAVGGDARLAKEVWELVMRAFSSLVPGLVNAPHIFWSRGTRTFCALRQFLLPYMEVEPSWYKTQLASHLYFM